VQHKRDSPAHEYSCTTCDRFFGSEEALEQHLRDSPAHPASFNCEECDRSFGSEEALEQHLCLLFLHLLLFNSTFRRLVSISCAFRYCSSTFRRLASLLGCCSSSTFRRLVSFSCAFRCSSTKPPLFSFLLLLRSPQLQLRLLPFGLLHGKHTVLCSVFLSCPHASPMTAVSLALGEYMSIVRTRTSCA